VTSLCLLQMYVHLRYTSDGIDDGPVSLELKPLAAWEDYCLTGSLLDCLPLCAAACVQPEYMCMACISRVTDWRRGGPLGGPGCTGWWPLLLSITSQMLSYPTCHCCAMSQLFGGKIAEAAALLNSVGKWLALSCLSQKCHLWARCNAYAKRFRL